MSELSTRLLLGFGAGALAHLVFQGALGVPLYGFGLIPTLVWNFEPSPPFGVPPTVNLMFWDGLWGLAYAALERRLPRSLGVVPRASGLAAASLLVFWFVVQPLKGQGVGGGFPPHAVAVQIAFDLVFGLATAALFGAGLRARRAPASSNSLRG
jgi:hypothetical protein